MAEVQLVHHAIEPIVAPDARALILGTMPSPASREVGFYYGHPRNRFWPVLARVLGCTDPGTIEGRTRLILDNRLALWDVLGSCEIAGAQDASITHPVANDVPALLRGTDIGAVFTTGAKAHELYGRLLQRDCGLAAVRLPSTSPANASWAFDDLVRAYEQIARFVSRP